MRAGEWPLAFWGLLSMARTQVFAFGKAQPPLTITGLKVTPIALPDPPLLAASGCHGPYFLAMSSNCGPTEGSSASARPMGARASPSPSSRPKSSWSARTRSLIASSPGSCNRSVWAATPAIELACLDACARATGRRLCELVGGPVRDPVEFAAYLFFRYAADHPVVMSDPHLVDPRGRGDRALDSWGEVRSPEAMAAMAARFRDRWGFRVFKLKGGVLAPEVERDSLKAMAAQLGRDALLRIDPNGRWRVPTAVRIGKEIANCQWSTTKIPCRVRRPWPKSAAQTGLKMSTNMCVTSFAHIPEALRLKPIDVLLCDHHYFGGFAGCLALGPICTAAGWSMSQHSNNHAGRHHGRDDSPGRLDSRADARQRHPLSLADRGHRHHRGTPSHASATAGWQVPAGPGLGVTLDADKLARAHETYQKCGMRGRDDRSLMRRIEPGWTGAHSSRAHLRPADGNLPDSTLCDRNPSARSLCRFRPRRRERHDQFE